MDALALRSDPLLAPSDGALSVWDPDRDDGLVVRQVRQETADVKTFVLASTSAARFSYQPGQFITLELEIGGARVYRCYTLSSTPTRPDRISITVKRVPGGTVSNFLHEKINEGAVLRAMGPMGDFTCTRHMAKKNLFLSGGSGITPVMSMARAHLDLATRADIVFLHNARTSADIVFRAELELMARNEPRFRFAAVCEADTPLEPWCGLRGRLSLAHLEAVAPDFCEREIFVCGPAPYMAWVRDLLRAAGFDMARYHEESFDFTALTAAATEATDTTTPEAEHKRDGVTTYRVAFSKSGQTIDCPADMNVLEAARRAGLRLPSSCTKGLCGTCKCRLSEGSVEMKHGGGIRQREIDAGMVLICCAKPTSDLIIER
jgi:glycine betaine catabolism B